MATCSGSRAQSTVSTEPTAASWSQPNPEPHRPHRAAREAWDPLNARSFRVLHKRVSCHPGFAVWPGAGAKPVTRCDRPGRPGHAGTASPERSHTYRPASTRRTGCCVRSRARPILRVTPAIDDAPRQLPQFFVGRGGSAGAARGATRHGHWRVLDAGPDRAGAGVPGSRAASALWSRRARWIINAWRIGRG
jgi:hypothetical protein